MTKGEGMTRSGLCAWPAFNRNSHEICRLETCTCKCYEGRDDA